MKTKIIYISGGETFEIADIQAAFDEVRKTLSLPSNTVLFGVPVDSEDSGIFNDSETVSSIIETPSEQEAISSETEPEVSEIKKSPAPKKKTSKKKQEIVSSEPADSDKIIPILSILSGNSDTTSEPDSVEETPTETVKLETISVEKVEIKEPDSVITAEKIVIEDIVADEAPEEEQTLEGLLEKITPLREDNTTEQTYEEYTDLDDESDTDETLEQLATEFIEKQDDILPEPKAETGGKIGKLKNILPFKKAKREDSGLMGDLFGWAGIAANDDEFSIPGFFTTSASKK